MAGSEKAVQDECSTLISRASYKYLLKSLSHDATMECFRVTRTT